MEGIFPFGTAALWLSCTPSLLLMDRLIYLLALGVISFVRLLPITVCFVLGQALGLLLWAILPRYRRLAKRNLHIAFGTSLSEERIDALARKHFTNLGANIICSIKIPALSHNQLRSRICFEPDQAYENWIAGKAADGKGTVAALSHFGNWEINAQIAAFVHDRKTGCVYQALRNSLMDDLVNRDRRTRGVRTFDRKKEMQGAATLLKEGGVVGILIDQHAGNAGIWMPLFEKLASTSPLAASLALRTESLLAMNSVRTTGLARWVIHTSAPIPTEGRDINEITMDLNRLLEQEIRNSPADWFWVHNRWKTPHPNFLLNDAKRGIYLPPGTTPSDLQPFNILVRSPNWLGDACMAAPAIRAIKAGRPDLRLTILSPAKLAPLWRELAEVDAVIEIPTNASPWKVARLIRASNPSSLPTPYDVAFLLPNSLRSALEVWLAGIPRRIGREMHRGGRLLNQRMSVKRQLHPTVHQADELLSMVRRLGAPEPQQLTPRTPPTGPVRIGLCPGAEYGPAKRWPTKRYRLVMENISLENDVTWVIVGTAKEAPLGDDLARNFPGKVENLCGKTTLPELIQQLKGFTLLLTNDTGTMHLADLLGVPVVAIFGSTDPALTGPGHLGGKSISLTPPHHVIRRKVECSPCFLRECPIDFRCMKEITPEMVTEAVLGSLQAIPEGV